MPASASAQYATGGSGAHRDSIIWFSWGTNGQAIPSTGTTVTRTFSLAGQPLAVTCALSNIRLSAGNLEAYRPGNWQGDGLDDLYNIGGTGSSNTLVIGLSNSSDGSTANFQFVCSATLSGNPFNLTGIVFADAEQSNASEYVQARTTSAGTTWRIIDGLASPAGCGSATASLTQASGQTTVRLTVPSASCTSGPMGVAFIEGATSADVEFKGGGKSAIALGVVVAGVDRGDAPASYGDATHLLQASWTRGVLPPGTTDINSSSFQAAALATTSLRLGQLIDGDPVAFGGTTASGDDTDNQDDEDALPAGQPGTRFVSAPGVGSTFTLNNIGCHGSGTLAGWIDFNRNGTFDNATERSATATCSGAASALTWTVPANVSYGATFVRLRVALNAAEVANPTGTASLGEVEDYPITLIGSQVAVRATIVARADPLDQFVVTIQQGATVASATTSGTSLTASSAATALVPGTNATLSITKAAGPTILSGYLLALTCDLVAESTGADPSLSGTSLTMNPGNNAICTFKVTAKPTITVTAISENRTGAFTFSGTIGFGTQTITTTTPGVAAVGTTRALIFPTHSTVTAGVPPAGFVLKTIACTGLGAGGKATPNLVARSVALDDAANAAGAHVTCTFTFGGAAIDATATAAPATIHPNGTITYTLSVSNTGSAPSQDTFIRNPIPPGTTYVAGSTTLNGGAVADQAGTSALVVGTAVHSPGAAAGVVKPGETATVRFSVTVDPTTTANISNTVTVDPDGSMGAQAAFTRSATTTVVPEADLQITQTGPTSVTAGTTVAYVMTVLNNGPSTAEGVLLAHPTPTGLSLVSVTSAGPGACSTATTFPCNLGNLAAGETRTVTATFAIPPTYTTPDPIVSVASVSTSTLDPSAANNTTTASSSLNAPVAALSVSTTNGVPSSVPGRPTTYTIVVSNAGPSNAGSVSVTDQFPADLTGVTWTCAAAGGGSCAAASGTGDIVTSVTLPPNASATFTATGTIAPEATGTLVTTATAKPPAGVSSKAASATDSDTLTPQTDLAMAVTGQVGSAVVGGDATFTLTVSNGGPSAATNVVVDAPGVTGLVLQSVSGACAAIPCAVSSLPAGQSSTVTAVYAVTEAFVGNTIALTATVSGAESDSATANNTATGQVQVDRTSDLGLRYQVSPASSIVGEVETLTLTVSNAGPAEATNVEVVAGLPAGLTLTRATPSQGTYTESSGEWAVGSIPSGGQVQLILTATVTQGGTMTAVAHLGRQDGRDPNAANNSASGSLKARVAADVGVALRGSNASPSLDEVVTLTVSATNAGPSPATNVQIASALPAGLTLGTATPSAGSYDVATGTWTIPTLAATDTAQLVVTATVRVGTPIVTRATRISPVEPDPNPLNDHASVTLNGGATANLVVTQSASNATPAVGSLVTFTIVATNLGPSQATAITVTDLLPVGLTYESATTTTGTYASGTGIWSFRSLDNGHSERLTLNARVATAGTFTNSISAQTLDQTDPDLTAPATVTVVSSLEADLSITNTLITPTIAGLPMQYRVVVSNNGPSPVSGATVIDTPPSPLLGITWTCVGSSGGSCASANGAGRLNSTVHLPSGAVTTFIVSGTLASGAAGSVSSVATVTVPTGSTELVPANNTARVSFTPFSSADLQVTNRALPNAVAGTLATFEMTVRNNGPSDASGIMLNAPTPVGLIFQAGSAPCGSFPCMIPDLAAGDILTLSITFSIPPGYATPDPIVGVVNVSSATPDPQLGNNAALASTAIAAPVADLVVTTVNNATSLVPGTSTTYTITVENAGPSSAAAARVQDLRGPEFLTTTWTCAAIGGATCGAATGNTGLDDIVNIPTSGRLTYTVTSEISPDLDGPLVNTAAVTVHASQADPNSSNNRATNRRSVSPAADLAVAVTGPATAVPGQTISYDVTVTNNGPSTARNVTVEFPPPSGLTFDSSGGACAATFPCDLGNIPPSGTRTFTVTFRVPSAYPSPGPIVAGVAVLGTTPDANATNDRASVTTTVRPSADISVAMSLPAVPLLVGDQALFTIDVNNLGPTEATGVVITDRLPKGLTFVSASDPSYDPLTGRWDIGILPNGGSAQLVLTAQVTEAGSIVNTAIKSGQNEPDPSPTNDVAAAAVNTSSPSDLVISITADRTAVASGDTVVFSLVVENLGPVDELAATASVTLPAGLTFVSAVPDTGLYSPVSGLWVIGTLANGTQAKMTLTATATSGLIQIISATASGTAGQDPLPLNNRVDVALNSAGTADIRVGTMASNSAPAVGGHVTYTIVATNHGPADASGVIVTDLLPAGVTLLTKSVGTGTYDATTGIWTIGTLAASRHAVLHVDVLATTAAPPAIVNTATRSGSSPADPNTTNDSASASISPLLVTDLAIAVTAGGPSVAAGDAATWTVTVTNHGPSPVVGAQVQDVFPAGFTGAWTCAASAGSSCPASGVGSFSQNINLLASGTASFVVTGVVGAGATGSIANAAVVVGPSGTTDPVSANNSASAAIAVVSIADLQIMAVANAATFTPAGPVGYTMTITNAGPSAATELLITNAVSMSVSGVTATCTVTGSGSCGTSASAGNLVSFGGGTLQPGPGNSLVITVAGTLGANAVGPVNNAAFVGALGTADRSPSNNSTITSVPVAERTDVQVTQTGRVRAAPGSTLLYTMTVTNAGPYSAENVQLDAPAPIGLTLVGVTGACTTFPCNLGIVAPGTTSTIVSRYSVPLSFTGVSPLTHRASISTTTADVQLANNVAEVSTTIGRPVCDVTGDGLPEFVTGNGAGGLPAVRVWSTAGGVISPVAEFLAYTSAFRGGVAVACGDVTGDGVPEIVTGAGPGGGPHVRLWNVTGGVVHEVLGSGFYAYSPDFLGGVHVAVDDTDGDGIAEIVTGAGPGGSPHVRIFSVMGGTLTERLGQGFHAYDPAFAGGTWVSAGDIDGDGTAEIITGAGPGGGPHVRIWSVAGNALTERFPFGVFAYSPLFHGGTAVAAGDIDGDGLSEIITGAGPGGGPHVRIWGVVNGSLSEKFGQGFYAYDPAFGGGVFVASADLNGDGINEIITGAGPGGGPHVRIFGYVGGVLTEYFGQGFFANLPTFPWGIFVGR